MQRSASTFLACAATLLCACDNRAPTPAAPAPPMSMTVAGMQAPPPAAGSGGQSVVPTPPPATPDAGPSVDAGPPVKPNLDAMVHTEDDEDAGPWQPPELACKDGTWQLAPGFLLAHKVDYVADRLVVFNSDGSFDGMPMVLSSAGRACANATDRAKCEAALQIPSPQPGRHLVTTAGDTVRIWMPGPAINSLFGVIDTPAEALWWVSGIGAYLIACDTKPEPLDGGGGWTVKRVYSSACGSVVTPMTHSPIDVRVTATGEMFELGLENPSGNVCGVNPGTPTGGIGGGMGGFGF